MTQQDDITQRVLTDAEIQALWDEACKDSPQAPGWNRHIRFARALLSKLRASVCQRCGGTGEADSGGIHPWGAPALIPCECTVSAPVARPWPVEEQPDGTVTPVDPVDMASAPVADERALDLLDTLFTAYENGTPCYEEPDSQGGYLGMAFRIDDDTFRACADLLNKERPRTAGALASAPVAGEAQPVGRVRHFNYSGVARNGFSQEAVLNDDAPTLPDGALLYAAPQASKDGEHGE